jgi:uncharacterized protein YdeI (YjbR/CyaY-like superfamily)
MSTDLPVLSFVDLPAWERWLKKHGDASSGIWMKLAKAGAPQPTLDKPKAIEGALCHGWIDGQIAKLDDHYFLVRFTRRRRGSRWSAVNRSSAQRLIEAGRMSEAGLRQIEAAKADGRWETAYPSQSKAQVPRDLLDALAANPAARQKFSELDSANRFAVIYRVQDAKKADTRARRIAQYVEMLAHGKTLHPPKRPSRVGAKRGARRRIISPSSQ